MLVISLGILTQGCLEKEEEASILLYDSDDSGPGDDGGSGTDTDSVGDTDTEIDTDIDQTTQTGQLKVTVRDFLDSHIDFENELGSDYGIVAGQLGEDGKPVYAGGSEWTTHGAGKFDQWYRDVAGVNKSMQIIIDLSEGEPGVYSYDNPQFFPIDDQLFGNQGRTHNYHFTTEIHAVFTYYGGELFSFTGDDDVFVFVNGHLAIDLGGVHGAMTGIIDMDARKMDYGLEEGERYAIDFFQAERHTSKSTFSITTTITDLTPI